MDIRTITHYFLHLGFPGILSFVFFKDRWKFAWLLMFLTMLIDVDHLLSNPIFDPNRCSIGFHPLHSYYAIVIYFAMLFFKKSRILAVGLMLHIFADFMDYILLIYL